MEHHFRLQMHTNFGLQMHNSSGLLHLGDDKMASISVGVIEIWDLVSFQCIQTLESASTCNLLLLSDKKFVSAAYSGEIKIWEMQDEE